VFHNILVPVDGSAPSDAAAVLAVKVAADEKASITFAHVVEVAKLVAMASPSSIDPTFAVDAARSAGQEILDAARVKASTAKLTISTVLLEGDTVLALLDLARDRKVDLIIVGSHGRGGIRRAILGSVAEGILRRSPVPVLVTHAPASAHEAGQKSSS
jgi:nucleotide-binding universal stress UspA family protein